MERKPEVILPCCHAYCSPCIEQWWEYCQAPPEDVYLPEELLEGSGNSCPLCRDNVQKVEDTWVLSERPDQDEVRDELKRNLISYATSPRDLVEAAFPKNKSET